VTPGLRNDTPTPKPELDKVVAKHNAPKPVNKVKRAAPPTPQTELASTTEEVVAQFIPLNYTRNSSQDGMVVRVEVSRASLIAMGLPLDAAHADGNVRADLKVGIDGVPLAIRLLQ
jgi:hypothetical protein